MEILNYVHADELKTASNDELVSINNEIRNGCVTYWDTECQIMGDKTILTLSKKPSEIWIKYFIQFKNNFSLPSDVIFLINEGKFICSNSFNPHLYCLLHKMVDYVNFDVSNEIKGKYVL